MEPSGRHQRDPVSLRVARIVRNRGNGYNFLTRSTHTGTTWFTHTQLVSESHGYSNPVKPIKETLAGSYISNDSSSSELLALPFDSASSLHRFISCSRTDCLHQCLIDVCKQSHTSADAREAEGLCRFCPIKNQEWLLTKRVFRLLHPFRQAKVPCIAFTKQLRSG